ncbi:MAG: 7TM domain-containing protein [Gammaproteobacteria bacterium]
MFAFPEFLLVILGICIWMGSYTGYRVSELFRFRDIKTTA